MSDKPGSSPPSEEITEMLVDETNTQSSQQSPTPPAQQPKPVQPKHQEEWSLKQEAKEWGKTLKESVMGIPELSPEEEIKRQIDEQKRIANLKQFFNKLDSQQQASLQKQQAEKQQVEQQKEAEKKQEDIGKKEEKKYVTQVQVLEDSQRRAERKKVGG